MQRVAEYVPAAKLVLTALWLTLVWRYGGHALQLHSLSSTGSAHNAAEGLRLE